MRNRIGFAAVLLAATSLLGCGGGGGGDGGGSGSTPQPIVTTPNLQVLPTTFDFGTVTAGNTSAPLEVTVRNTGTAPLVVSSIAFSATTSAAFAFDFAGGTTPCGSPTPTVAAGASCDFRVTFQPPGNGAFAGEVQIASNDPDTPAFSLPISGTSEALSTIAVRVNQVDTNCPTNDATAWVSVTDQGGFPVLGLTTNDFTLRQGSPLSANLLLDVTRLDAAYKPIAVTALVDNSGSITDQPVAYADMKNGFATLFNSMQANDVGELINFGTTFEVTVPFPSPSSTSNPTNKDALVNGLAVPWTGQNNTLLYDTLIRAVDDTAIQTSYRRAVVVASDGRDDNGSGTPVSVSTLSQVISNAVAKNVPIFTIGLGANVRTQVLQDLATQTGGVYYRANTSQNLATIYQQLSSLLFQNQYRLRFNQLAAGPNVVSPLRVDVVTPTGVTGNGLSSIVSCN